MTLRVRFTHSTTHYARFLCACGAELMQRLMDNGKLTLLQHAENRQRLGTATDKLKQMVERQAQ